MATNFNLKRGRAAQTAAALAFAWLPLNFAGASGGYTPPVGTCGFDRLTGGAIVDDPQSLFDLEPGSPPADATALAFAWGNRVVNFAGAAGGYRPQTSEVHFPPQYGRPLDFHGTAGGYTPPNYGGVRFGPAPKPSGTVDFATEAGGYYPPLALVDLPRDSTQQASWPPEPPPEIMRAYGLPWSRTEARSATLTVEWAAAPGKDTDRKAPWTEADDTDQHNTLDWSQFTHQDTNAALLWAEASEAADQHMGLLWGDPPGKANNTGAGWDESVQARDAWDALLWGDPPAKQDHDLLPWRHTRYHPEQRNTDVIGLYEPPRGDAVDFDLTGGHDFAGVSGGYSAPSGTVDFAGTSGAEPYPDGVGLVFEWGRLATAKLPGIETTDSSGRTDMPWGDGKPTPRTATLVWGEGNASDGSPFLPWDIEEPETEPDYPDEIPEQDTYTMSSSLTVTRVSDSEPIKVLSASAGLTMGDFAWRARLALADAQGLADVMPSGGSNQLVDIEINGFKVRCIVESWSRETVFGKTTWVASCRGQSAELDEPYFGKRDDLSTSSATAAQIATAELTGTGWTCNWPAGLDWTLDAGEWFYTDLTPIRAIARLAETIGAFVLPDPTAKTLNIVSRLPHKPSQWAVQTPDAVVYQAAVVRIGHQYEPRPEYDYIQVAGTQPSGPAGTAIAVEATKMGEPGTSPAPDIVDEFVTDSTVGQERARVELYNSGPRAIERRQWPILDPVGVRQPAELIRNVDEAGGWFGLVTDVQISGAWDGDGLKCWQNITQDRRGV